MPGWLSQPSGSEESCLRDPAGAGPQAYFQYWPLELSGSCASTAGKAALGPSVTKTPHHKQSVLRPRSLLQPSPGPLTLQVILAKELPWTLVLSS